MLTCTFENGNEASLRHVIVDTITVQDNKILLIKRAVHMSNPNKYALPGGYLNRDEITAEGAIRETLEETGYKVKVNQLFLIIDNPNRKNEDRQNVNFTYLAEVEEKAGEADKEVTLVKWFYLDNLPPEKEFAFDHFEIISLYKKYLMKNFNLPLFK